MDSIKKPVSMGTRSILFTSMLLGLVMTGFFSLYILEEVVGKGLVQELSPTQGIVVNTGTAELLPDIIVTPESSVATPESPVNTLPSSSLPDEEVFAYQSELLSLFPGATVTGGKTTSTLFESIPLRDVQAVQYLLNLPTGELATMTVIKKGVTATQSPFVLLQTIISEQGNTQANSTPTTMSQKPAFYYNRLDKAQNVGIVIEHKSGEVYVFDYPSGYHQTFKSFFQML